jgi:DNA-binding NarL/FixJ family response regulator
MRIVIVEDQKLLRDNLSLLLGGENGMAVAGAFGSAEDALAGTDWQQVDVLLADIDLPGISGVDLVREVKARCSTVNCMAYTIYEDRATLFSAIKAGACGYLLKGCSPRELVESVRELYAGGAPMSPKIARRVILDIQADGQAHEEQPAAVLSKSEIAVLRHIEQGHSYKEVGRALSISPHTVHTHIKRIYEKVQAKDRDEALRRARHLGVL